MKAFVRILLGTFFMFSSVSKLSSLEGFELYIFSFEFFSFDLSSILARLVIIAEFIIGAGLASGQFYRFFKYSTAMSLLGFSIFLIWRMLLGDTESCHCMGDIVDMNPLQSLLKNLVLALMLVFCWNAAGRQYRFRLCAASSLVVLVSVAVFAAFPPDAYYRIGRQSEDLSMETFAPVADSLGLSEGRKLICMYSASCEHCRRSASKMAGIIRRHNIPTDSVSVIFMQTHENQDSVSTEFFRSHGESLMLPYSYLHPYVFIPVTNGSMPLVLLFDEGRLVKEYDYFSIDEKEISAFMNQK